MNQNGLSAGSSQFLFDQFGCINWCHKAGPVVSIKLSLIAVSSQSAKTEFPKIHDLRASSLNVKITPKDNRYRTCYTLQAVGRQPGGEF
jgi:hypothetical protein